MKNVKIGDIIVIAAVVFASLALLCYSLFVHFDNAVLLVSFGNNEDCYDLDEDRIITVENNGHTVVIEIKEGKARVVSSTCDGQDCVNMRSISLGNETIACLPARVFLKVVSDGGEEGYDGVVG